MVENAFHLYAAAGVSDAESGTRHQALQGGGAVRGAHQAPVGFIVEPLQNLHSLSPPHRQLVAVTSHEIVDHHCQLTATRQLTKKENTVQPMNRTTSSFKHYHHVEIHSHLVAVQRVLRCS